MPFCEGSIEKKQKPENFVMKYPTLYEVFDEIVLKSFIVEWLKVETELKFYWNSHAYTKLLIKKVLIIIKMFSIQTER